MVPIPPNRGQATVVVEDDTGPTVVVEDELRLEAEPHDANMAARTTAMPG